MLVFAHSYTCIEMTENTCVSISVNMRDDWWLCRNRQQWWKCTALHGMDGRGLWASVFNSQGDDRTQTDNLYTPEKNCGVTWGGFTTENQVHSSFSFPLESSCLFYLENVWITPVYRMMRLWSQIPSRPQMDLPLMLTRESRQIAAVK